jgi:hypothetical protein
MDDDEQVCQHCAAHSLHAHWHDQPGRWSGSHHAAATALALLCSLTTCVSGV